MSEEKSMMNFCVNCALPVIDKGEEMFCSVASYLDGVTGEKKLYRCQIQNPRGNCEDFKKRGV